MAALTPGTVVRYVGRDDVRVELGSLGVVVSHTCMLAPAHVHVWFNATHPHWAVVPRELEAIPDADPETVMALALL